MPPLLPGEAFFIVQRTEEVRPMQDPAALELAAIDFGWAGRPFITQLSLRVQPGEFIALVGPSGAGKSTIFRLVAGLLPPASGRLLVGAEPTAPGRVGS